MFLQILSRDSSISEDKKVYSFKYRLLLLLFVIITEYIQTNEGKCNDWNE